MPRDAIDHDAAGAGLVHLERIASLLDRARHEASLAEACSDLCASSALTARLASAELALNLKRAWIKAEIEWAARSRSTTGIHARKCLPSPTYDHLFKLIAENGRTLCVMVPGHTGYDPDYWEEVPSPGGNVILWDENKTVHRKEPCLSA
jgi:hypothetical protein